MREAIPRSQHSITQMREAPPDTPTLDKHTPSYFEDNLS